MTAEFVCNDQIHHEPHVPLLLYSLANARLQAMYKSMRFPELAVGLAQYW